MTESGKSALLVVDIVNDFVTGVFGSDKGRETAERIASVLSEVEGGIDVIFTKDSHIEGDPEFKVWGAHCIDGTDGAQLYPSLEKFEGFHIKKRHFDSFFDSDLDGLLRAKDISRLYICGISTDICVLHTVSGAFFRYYDITVIEDLCSSIDPSRHESALKDMITNYGARVITSREFIREVM